MELRGKNALVTGATGGVGVVQSEELARAGAEVWTGAEAVAPLVWSAGGRDDFVADVQAMRRRVEEHIRPDHAERELKLGPGGLRDVEFAVQLLQLVHGRTDEDLRSPSTLRARSPIARSGRSRGYSPQTASTSSSR